MKTLTVRIKNKKAFQLLKDLENDNLIELLNEPISVYEARKVIRKAEKSKSIPLLEAKAISETWKKNIK